MDKVIVFDLSFDEIALPDLAYNITQPTQVGQMVVTPNVDHLIRYHHSEEFKDLLSHADITVNDSRIIRLLSFFCGHPVRNLVPGSDLTKVIFEKIAGSSIPICIIGCDDASTREVCAKYNVSNFSHYNPPMGFDKSPSEVQKCVNFCLANPAQIFFIVVGSPRQELLAKRLKDTGIHGYFLCVGASILFLAGLEQRAPQWMQLLCLEWLYRLISNPRRLAKRYLIDGWGIVPIVVKQLRRGGRRRELRS